MLVNLQRRRRVRRSEGYVLSYTWSILKMVFVWERWRLGASDLLSASDLLISLVLAVFVVALSRAGLTNSAYILRGH